MFWASRAYISEQPRPQGQRLRAVVHARALPSVLWKHQLLGGNSKPRGSRNTTIMESGPQNHNGDGLLGANSIIVVYMDPLGKEGCSR